MGIVLPELLTAAAGTYPDSPAVEDGPDVMSYAELEARSSRLARVLLDNGTKPGDRVALYLDKSIAAVVAVYGILKAGCIYVPLDTQAPLSRLAHILRDCDVRCVVSESNKKKVWSELGRAGNVSTFVAVDATGQEPAKSDHFVTSDSDTALILYTSGSTGHPKGVSLSHRNVMTFVSWAARHFELSPRDRLSSHAPFHFDLSTFDLFAAASAGSAVVLVPKETSVFPVELGRFIAEKKLTTWYSVPSALTLLTLRGRLETGDLRSLRTVLFAGEVFPTKHLRTCMSLLPHARFHNLYGPTETNVCTHYEVPSLTSDDDRPIPIGKAIEGVDVFAMVTDRLADVEEVGELYVSGPSVMQGYWGKPEETSRVLVHDPRPDHDGLVYKTGDFVVKKPGGDFRFVGRGDSQIKTRGYRVELGEIEAAVNAHPKVVECAVVAVPDDIVTNRLEAFVAVREPISRATLTTFCSKRLPRYMIPDRFVFLDSLPKTSTGKIDRQFLKEEAT